MAAQSLDWRTVIAEIDALPIEIKIPLGTLCVYVFVCFTAVAREALVSLTIASSMYNQEALVRSYSLLSVGAVISQVKWEFQLHGSVSTK